MIVDLAGHKDTVTILSQLQSGFPFPETAEQRAVVDMLGEHNLRIVGQAMAAIQVTYDAYCQNCILHMCLPERGSSHTWPLHG